ncbi:MAG: histidinol-phosphatase HisJ family protein [Hespellia sp.]|nr:histidinol-phosphatase HisJ family protein [Hespellia sp.]
MISDSHMHTSFSGDCDTPVRDMVEGAIKAGLTRICFTDHLDKDYPAHEEEGDSKYDFDVNEYFKVMQSVKQEYADRIDIRIGVEIGLQEHLKQFYHEYVSTHSFDFVIGSMHVIHGRDPYYGEYFEGKTDEEAYREAFLATVDNIKAFDDYDVLGHIDYVTRYGKERAKYYSYQKFADEIDLILKTVIEHGKGIELNTSGYKYGLGFCHPHPDIIKRYRELGGEIITIGADGHKPEHVAYEYSKVKEVLRDAGFTYYTEFERREPIFRQLL